MNTSKGTKQKRLIFIISSEMNLYLAWASKYRNTSKSSIVRNAIKSMKEFKENEKLFTSQKETNEATR